MKKTLLLFSLSFLLALPLFAADTITCYSATYDAVTIPYFSNTAFKSIYPGKEYVAKLGTLTISVTPTTTGAENYSGTTYYDSDYLHAIYFRNPQTGTNTGVLKTQTGNASFPVHLIVVASFLSGASLNSVSPYSKIVDLTEASRNPITKSNETLVSLLDSILITQATTAGPVGALCFQGVSGDIISFTFFLRCEDSGNAKTYEGNNFFFDSNSTNTFSSMSSLCVYHNYGTFLGSVIPTANIGGDLAFFPSDHYSNPIYFGDNPPAAGELQCWVQFDALKKKIDVPQSASDVTELTKASVLLFGNTTRAESYTLEFTITDTSGSATDGFKLKRSSSNNGNYPTFSYTLLASGSSESPVTDSNGNSASTITWGDTYLWKGILPGNKPGPNRNQMTLSLTGLNPNESVISGTYQDTLIVTIKAADY